MTETDNPGTGQDNLGHFNWCVGRAIEYLDAGDAVNAMASLTSDLGKHPGTCRILNGDLHMLMFGEYAVAGVAGVRRFIEGLPGPAAEVAG